MRFPVGHQQFHWHLELSSKCTLRCPRCPRTEKMGLYQITELSFATLQRTFTPDYIRNHMLKLLLCGGQGDPIYNSRFLDIVRYFKTARPDLNLVIATNGSHKKPEFWQELRAALNAHDDIIFSVDGWDQESNAQYRVGSDFASIRSAVQTMAGGPAKVLWTTIVFKFNQNDLVKIRDLARDLGVDEFNLTLSSLFGSHDPYYLDPASGFDPLEPDAHFVSTLKRTQRLRQKLTGRKRPHSAFDRASQAAFEQVATQDGPIFPLCRGGNRGLYVDASGILYPCSWVSHPFEVRKSAHRQIRFADSFWTRHRDRFNLHLRSLPDILNDELWLRLERGWSDGERTFIECAQKCGSGKCASKDLKPKELNLESRV